MPAPCNEDITCIDTVLLLIAFVLQKQTSTLLQQQPTAFLSGSESIIMMKCCLLILHSHDRTTQAEPRALQQRALLLYQKLGAVPQE